MKQHKQIMKGIVLFWQLYYINFIIKIIDNIVDLKLLIILIGISV